jgi:DNA-binding CsgD family transcriptional regulator
MGRLRRCSGCISDVEARILAEVASGDTDRLIARQLHVADSTVRYHIGKLMKLTKTANRSALIATAFVAGILSVRVWPIETTAHRHLAVDDCWRKGVSLHHAAADGLHGGLGPVGRS